MNPLLIPDIPGRLDEETAKRIKISPHKTNRASEAGHPCERFLVLARTKNDLRILHTVDLQRIFDEGNAQEKILLAEITAAGFDIVEQARPYEWAKFELTGMIDSKVKVESERIPLELKSSSPYVFSAIKELEANELVTSKFPWIRKYPAQLLMYMLMDNIDAGIFLFKNKTTGEKCQKNLFLDGPNLDYAEEILKKLERVNAHVHAGTEPPAVLIEDCKGCPFAKTACFTGQDYGPGLDILQDPELEAKLNRRGEILELVKEYEALDKELKEGFRGRNVVVGDWMVESRGYEMTKYNWPDKMKKEYAVKIQAFRTSIEKI